VQFKLGRKLAAIEAEHVVLDDGTTARADVVLLGIGVLPDVALAEAAGIETDRGVLVNEYMETSIANIYAAGDIARYPDAATGARVRIEHWVVAQRQGQAVARNILRQRSAFTRPAFFWTRQYDRTVCYVGHAEDYTTIREDGSGDDYAAALLKGEQLLALITIGRDRESLRTERALEQAVAAPLVT
jgi:apoptosis-inducing factor 3